MSLLDIYLWKRYKLPIVRIIDVNTYYARIYEFSQFNNRYAHVHINVNNNYLNLFNSN